MPDAPTEFRIYETEWFAQPALAIETAAFRLITVPSLGAKIVSIFDRHTEREWLLPPKDGRLSPVDYGASFVDQDMSGWDEMFPTINRCHYPLAGRHFGKDLPDHGEVWALAWHHSPTITDALRMSVQCHALPYTLTRTIRAVTENRLRLSYKVVNTGEEPLIALWTAHPQFAVNTETRILLPKNITQVINVLATDELPIVGQNLNWAEVQMPDGECLSLDRVRSASEHKCRKIYLPPGQPAHWAGLQQGENGAWLRLSWDVDEIPYLGIWVDEGTYNPVPTVALEPSTGYYDILTQAWQNNRVMHLLPNTPVKWSLDLQLGTGILG